MSAATAKAGPATGLAPGGLAARSPSRLSSFVNGVTAIWLRELTIFRREKARVVSSLISPLMWIFLMGGGIGSFASDPVPGVSYQRFIFPGIVIMSILFGSLFFGFYVIWDRKIDVLRAVLVAPVPRTAVFFGKTLGGCTDMMIQALLLMVLGIAIAGIPPLAIPVGLLVAFLAAVSLVALGLAIGSMFESTEGFQVIVTFLAFPLFFLSGALFPLDSAGLPDWLRHLTAANPVTYAVDAMRWALLGFGAFPLALDLAAMGGFTAAMVLIGTWAFSRMK